MMKNGFKDTRLLEALDYIDTDLIGEVAVKLKFEENAPLAEEPVMTWRTPFKHWKRMLATAACLLLLSCTIPIINYVLPRVGVAIGGNAGAGTSDVEANEYDSPYERAIDAYPADMPADEIYADVLKGGWVVNTDGEIVEGEKYWEEFLSKTDNKTESSVLIAFYDENREAIFLKSVSYNGEVYNCDLRYICQPESKDRISSFSAKYLVCHDMTSSTYEEKRNWDPPTKFVWFLTDYPEIPYIEQLIVYESEHYEFLKDNYPTWMDLIWLNELDQAEIGEELSNDNKVQYEYTPSIGSPDMISEVGVTIGHITVEAQKHISAVYNCTGKNEASGEFIYSTLGEGIIFFEKGIPDGCPILRAEGSAKITVLMENLGFRMSLYDMSGRNDVRGVEGTTIYLPTAPGLYYLNIFVDVDHPLINDEIVPVIGNQYVAQYRYLAAIVVE